MNVWLLDARDAVTIISPETQKQIVRLPADCLCVGSLGCSGIYSLCRSIRFSRFWEQPSAHIKLRAKLITANSMKAGGPRQRSTVTWILSPRSRWGGDGSVNELDTEGRGQDGGQGPSPLPPPARRIRKNKSAWRMKEELKQTSDSFSYESVRQPQTSFKQQQIS